MRIRRRGRRPVLPAGDGSDDPVGTTSESSPFTVGHQPDGYRLVQAGRGTIPQTWSSDSFGDDEPITVLAPPGVDPGGTEAVRVSLTGFEGFQGGLEQALAGYMSDESESFELDGRRAIYTPAHEREGGDRAPADLVVVAGDDLAVRVQAAEASRDELIDVARQVEPEDDHLLAPRVPDPPGDLEVVGSSDADVAVTLVASPTPSSDALPAGERAHTTVWARGARGTAWTPEAGVVAVSTLPGQALDLDVVAASLHQHDSLGPPQVDPVTVDGRPGVVLELPGSDGDDGGDRGYGALRAVVTASSGGDLLLVVAHGEELPAPDELIAVAASVEPATPEEWERLVVDARGGPGLHPDEGAVELARGTAGDVEWLFQSRVDDGTVSSGATSSEDPDTTGQYVVDPCLKLSGGERACATGSSGTAGSDVRLQTAHPTSLDGGGGAELPGFVMVTAAPPAATMRVHTPDGVVDVPLVTLPGGTHRAAVLVTEADLGPLPMCSTTGQPGAVELLDESAQPLPC